MAPVATLHWIRFVFCCVDWHEWTVISGSNAYHQKHCICIDYDECKTWCNPFTSIKATNCKCNQIQSCNCCLYILKHNQHFQWIIISCNYLYCHMPWNCWNFLIFLVSFYTCFASTWSKCTFHPNHNTFSHAHSFHVISLKSIINCISFVDNLQYNKNIKYKLDF